jgi:hypothetical protein
MREMNRSLLRRISKLEQFLPEALEQREERRIELEKKLPWAARLHATEVAAIVLAGKPKVDEPLGEAWTRTLDHFGARECYTEMRSRLHTRLDEPLGEVLLKDYRSGYHPLLAAEKLYVEMITRREEEKSFFSKTLKNAPAWLLKFTLVPLDARCLNFDPPDLSAAPAWGIMGLRDARRWPLLPQGIMTAGHPVPNREHEIPSVEQCSASWFLKWPVREWALNEALVEKRLASYLKMLAENGTLNSADPSDESESR